MQDQRKPTLGDREERIFAARVREMRETKGLSQTALADALKSYGFQLDGTAITRIEKASRTIRLGEAAAISRVFNTTIDQMLRPAPTLKDQLMEAHQSLQDARQAAARAEADVARLTEVVTVLQTRWAAERDADRQDEN